MSYHPKYCTLAYVISCLLDAVDGQAARALGQTSKFGAVLDMVTDRCVISPLTPPAPPALSHSADLQVYDVVLALLSIVCIPKLCHGVPVPYRT